MKSAALRTFVLGGVLGAGIVSGGALAFAQSAGTTVPPATSGTTPGPAPEAAPPGDAAPAPPGDKPEGACDEPGGKGRHGGRGFHLGADSEALASELGVTVEQLREAVQAGRQAVDARPDIEKPATRPPSEEERAKLEADLRARADVFARTTAEKLGITPERLKEAGTAVARKKLDEAVAAGKLTQEQADKLLAKMADGDGLGLGGPLGTFGHDGPRHRGPGGDGKRPGGS